jgi:hypothetical protein
MFLSPDPKFFEVTPPHPNPCGQTRPIRPISDCGYLKNVCSGNRASERPLKQTNENALETLGELQRLKVVKEKAY